VTKINFLTFDSCTGLSNVTIPNSVTFIDDYTFWFCTGLKNITVGSGVTNISSTAFSSCSALTSAFFFGNAPEIDHSVFADCAPQFTVYYLSSSTGFTNPWYGYKTVDATRPVVKATAGNGSATLTWDAVANATAYAVAYQNGSSWVTLTTNCTGTMYTASNLVAGKTYTFLVQAKVNGSWSKFDSTDLVTATPTGATKAAAVSAVGDGSATLTWNAVSGATKYAIEYQNGSSWTTLTLNCTGTTYTATNLVSGKTYTFLVQSYADGKWSNFSSSDYVTATPTGATKPTAAVTAVGDGSANLSWNAVSGATKYAIAYQNGNSWTTLTPNCTGTTYTATGLTNHKEYTFLVQSYADGKWSSFNSSDYVTGTPLDAARPFVKATAGNGSATLTWDAVANATAYAVAYQNGSSWVTLTTNCTGTTYTATNLVAGKAYTFLVQAKVNGSWSKFDNTDYVTATPTGN